MNDPDTLSLTKEQVLDKFEIIERDIMKSDQGIKDKVKFKLVFGFINWLVNHYDITVLNRIFLSMIKEFDDMRYMNALEGNEENETLKRLKQIKKQED